MAIPDRLSEQTSHEFQWTDNPLSSSTEIHAHTPGCNTIVFDSFSSEEDVKRRNAMNNNVSKINDSNRRFSTDFNIRFSGRVSAVLCPGSTGDYRVVDAKRRIQPSSSSPPSFSSIISSTSPSNNNPTSATTTPPARQQQQDEDDSQLIASLAASACTAAPPPPQAKTLMAELSLVADRLVSQHHEGGAPPNTERTDQLRKRCQTMMTRGPPQPLTVNFTSPPTAPRQQHQFSFVPNHTTTDKRVTTNLPVADHQRRSTGFFFAPIPRPAEVERTLLDLLQTEKNRGQNNKRARESDMDADGHALHSGGSNGGAPGGGEGLTTTTTSAWTPCTSSSLAPPLSSADDSRHDFSGALDPTNVFAAYKYYEPRSEDDGTHVASSNAPRPQMMMIAAQLPPMITSPLTPTDDDEAPVAIYHHHHHHYHPQPRISSSDLIFTSMVCPVPIAGLINLSDVKLRHSSEEMLALSVLQDLGGRK